MKECVHMTFCCCCLVIRSCTTLCGSMDYSLPGSSIHGTSQARTLQWLLFPSQGDLPDPGKEPVSPELAGGLFTTESPQKPSNDIYHFYNKNKNRF